MVWNARGQGRGRLACARHRAHQRGLAGASVFRGIEGFGAASRIHTSRLLSLSEDLPLAIIIVDSAERTDAFLDEIADLVTGGLVMVDDVYVHTYIGGGADATDGGAAGGGAAGGAAGGPTGGPAGSGTG
jgi:PII-like signaling protein